MVVISHEIYDDQESVSFTHATTNWDGSLPRKVEQRFLTLISNAVFFIGTAGGRGNKPHQRAGKNLAGGDWREMLLAHLPILPDQNLQLSERLITTDLELEILITIQELRSRLALANSLSASFAKYPADLRHKGGVHIEVLGELWHGLCETLISAIEGLTAAQAGALATPSSTRNTAFIALLQGCSAGETPCIMSDGSVEIPGIAERRRRVRRIVNIPASPILGPISADATVINISPGGCCLQSDEILSEGETITLQLQSERKLTGVVMWSQENQCGIQFTVSLEQKDPLLPQI